MSNIINRPVVEQELPATLDLFLEAVADIFERHHLKLPLPPRPAVEVMYRHIFQTGIFRVAEEEGKLAAICHAIVRDKIWFLSGFWARPERQGQGVGGKLLREVWREGERQGAEKFFVWSSIDETAIASYLKMGMLPGYQLLTFSGKPRALPAAPENYTVEPLTLETACAIDREIRETGREVDHLFWHAQVEMTGRQVTRADGRVIGYYYFKGEAVGPVAWTEREAAEALMTLACRDAVAQSETLSLRVPGINHDAIRFALQNGLRLNGNAHLFTTAPVGRAEQYLASGPALF